MYRENVKRHPFDRAMDHPPPTPGVNWDFLTGLGLMALSAVMMVLAGYGLWRLLFGCS